MKKAQKTQQNIFSRRAFYLLFTITALLTTSCTGVVINKTENIPQDNQSITCEISAYELHKILTAHFGYVRIKMSDSQYILPDNNQVIQLSAPSRYELYGAAKSIREKWDCDDYAIAAMAPMRNYAFGVMYITTTNNARHVINVFVNNKKEIIYWEPQTCRYYNGQFYKPELILF